MRTLKPIKAYEKRLVRTIEWSMTPEQLVRFLEDLDKMDEELEQNDFKRGKPKISQYQGYVVYEYKRKPKIYFDPHTQKVRVSSKDYEKNKIRCHNQAFFLLQTLHTLGYMNVKFGKFRIRRDLKSGKEKKKARELLEKRFEPERKPIEWE